MDEDASAEVLKGRESAGRVVQGLNNAVGALAGNVGDALEEVAQEIWEMTLEHLRYPHSRRQAVPHAARVPLIDEFLNARGINVVPQPAELLFNRPRPNRLQSVSAVCLKASPLP